MCVPLRRQNREFLSVSVYESRSLSKSVSAWPRILYLRPAAVLVEKMRRVAAGVNADECSERPKRRGGGDLIKSRRTGSSTSGHATFTTAANQRSHLMLLMNVNRISVGTFSICITQHAITLM